MLHPSTILFDAGRGFGVFAAAFAIGAGMKTMDAVQKWWKDRHQHVPLPQTNARDIEINKLLRQIRREMGATRAYIGRFSNGVVYLNRSEIMNYSWAYEDVGEGASQAADKFQGIKTSLVPEELSLADEPGPGFRTVDSLPEGRLKRMCWEFGVKSIARCRIGESKLPVGFIGLDYQSSSEPPENIGDLVQYAGRLQEMLGG